jgi:hypothetical protein
VVRHQLCDAVLVREYRFERVFGDHGVGSARSGAESRTVGLSLARRKTPTRAEGLARLLPRRLDDGDASQVFDGHRRSRGLSESTMAITAAHERAGAMATMLSRA